MMKNVLLFFLAIVVGAAVMFGVQTLMAKNKLKLDARYEKSSSFSPDKAPSESLIGKLLALSGEVEWQSRTATEAAKISSNREIKQGEILKTTTGSATVQFENNAKIIISPNSELDIIQTLPSNLVFMQNKGTVKYNRIGEVPISIRVMHLLIDQGVGDILVGINPENEIISIDVKDGKVTAAFNDLDYNSKVLEVTNGKKLIFNDRTRNAEVK